MLNRSKRSSAADLDALELCGVISLEPGPAPQIADAEVVEFRDLGALVRQARFTPVVPGDEEIAAYRAVVEGAFATRSVVPAPVGTIFRSRDLLLRWLELHYFTLADALRYLNDRQVARVRVTPSAPVKGWDTREHRLREADLEVTAFTSFRALKLQAVAFIPIDAEGRRTIQGAEAAFLVDRERWNSFASLVKEEQRRLPDVRLEQTGPWPPYDFVRLALTV